MKNNTILTSKQFLYAAVCALECESERADMSLSGGSGAQVIPLSRAGGRDPGLLKPKCVSSLPVVHCSDQTRRTLLQRFLCVLIQFFNSVYFV